VSQDGNRGCYRDHNDGHCKEFSHDVSLSAGADPAATLVSKPPQDCPAALSDDSTPYLAL
jgi:hypothetical protein